MKRLLHAACVLLSISLVACGGGGGGNGGGGQPVTPSSVTLDTPSILFVASAAQPSPSATVTMSFTRPAWVVGTPTDVDVPTWLDIGTTGQTTLSPVTFILGVKNTGSPLAQGQYSTVLRFATANKDGSDFASKDLPVTLVVAHLLAAAQSQLVVVQGQDPAVARTSLALTANGVNWTARSDSAWLGIDQSTGSGSATLTANVLDSSLAPGSHVAKVTVTDVDHHVDVSVDIALQVDPRQQVVRTPGVALTSIANQQVLSATVAVADTAGLASTWSAASDQSWLTVDTPSGSVATALAFHADPTGLADGMHYATVNVASTTAGVAGTSHVSVGLWIDHGVTAPASLYATRREPHSTEAGYGVLIGDPIRPYVYESLGDDEIDVFNVYTGAMVGHVSLAGAGLASMTMAPDGSVLLAADQFGGRLFPIDPSTLTVGAPLGGIVPVDFNFRMTAGFVGTRLVLATDRQQLFDASTGALLRDFGSTVASSFDFMGWPALSHDGRTLLIQEAGLEPHTLTSYSISADGAFQVAQLQQVTEPGFGFGYGVAFGADDSILVSVSNGGDAYYFGNLFQPATIGGTEGPQISGLAVRRDGGFFVAANDGNGNGIVESFDRAALPLGTVYSGASGGFVGGLQLSGDQRRLVVDGGDLYFVQLP